MRSAVLSPPGITRPSSASTSAGLRTSRTVAPSRSRAAACAAKSPWRARTPTSSACAPWARGLVLAPPPGTSPPPRLAPLALGQLRHLEARHGFGQLLGHLGEDVGVAEVGRGLDDGAGARRGVGGLEDPRADED